MSWKRADIYIYIHLLSHSGWPFSFFFAWSCVAWTLFASNMWNVMRLSGENSFGHSGTHGVGCLGVLGWGGIAFVELAHMVDATHCWVGWVVGTVQIVPCANATRFAINALWPKTGPDKPRWTSVPSRPLPKLCLFQLTLRIGYRHRRNQQNASGTRIKKGRIRIRLLPPNLTPQNIHRYIVDVSGHI